MEVLAPAGNVESLKAALCSGADAVYLGIGKYNARVKADNFTIDNISEWVQFCHFHNCKVYLTLNTNVLDNELDDIKLIIIAAQIAHVDAFIIADLAVAKLASEIAPNIARHASTQMGVHNLQSAKLVERLGFRRVVLARETTLADIRLIRDNCDIEIEYFVQGALCVCFSGGCLFSALTNGNSGNRGACLQPCRKMYNNTINNDEAYYLSAKDQNLMEHIGQLKECGVVSLKIEGRMRSPHYVAAACRAVKMAVSSGSVDKNLMDNLKVGFNRGNYTGGYNFDSVGNIVYTQHQGHIGLNIGEIKLVKAINNRYLITFKTDGYTPRNKCGVKIIRDNIEVDGFMLDNIRDLSNNTYEFTCNNQLFVGDNIHITKNEDIDICDDIKYKMDFDIEFSYNGAVKLTARSHGLELNLVSDCLAVKAISSPITRESLLKKFNLTMNNYFKLSEFTVINNYDYFMPLSKIISMRDILLNQMYHLIIDSYDKANKSNLSNKDCAITTLREEVHRTEYSQFVIANYDDIDKVMCLAKTAVIVNYDKKAISILQYSLNERYYYIKLPKVAVYNDLLSIIEDIKLLPNTVGIYADSLYAVQLALENDRDYIIGAGLNVFNSIAAKLYAGSETVASLEMNSGQIAKIENSIVYAYGYVPVMTVMHCPYSVVTGRRNCSNCDYTDFNYADKFGEYRVRRLKLNKCYFTIYNSKCHYLLDILKKSRALIDLTVNNVCEISDNRLVITKPVEYTRGFYNK